MPPRYTATQRRKLLRKEAKRRWREHVILLEAWSREIGSNSRRGEDGRRPGSLSGIQMSGYDSGRYLRGNLSGGDLIANGHMVEEAVSRGLVQPQTSRNLTTETRPVARGQNTRRTRNRPTSRGSVKCVRCQRWCRTRHHENVDLRHPRGCAHCCIMVVTRTARPWDERRGAQPDGWRSTGDRIEVQLDRGLARYREAERERRELEARQRAEVERLARRLGQSSQSVGMRPSNARTGRGVPPGQARGGVLHGNTAQAPMNVGTVLDRSNLDSVRDQARRQWEEWCESVGRCSVCASYPALHVDPWTRPTEVAGRPVWLCRGHTATKPSAAGTQAANSTGYVVGLQVPHHLRDTTQPPTRRGTRGR